MTQLYLLGRRRPAFVESVNGEITDVITPNFVEVGVPEYPRFRSPLMNYLYARQSEIISTPGFTEINQPVYPDSESLVVLPGPYVPRQTVIYRNVEPLPYSIVFVDDRQPYLVAVKYRPRRRVIISPYSELEVD
jgi:hypothetical protein